MDVVTDETDEIGKNHHILVDAMINGGSYLYLAAQLLATQLLAAQQKNAYFTQRLKEIVNYNYLTEGINFEQLFAILNCSKSIPSVFIKKHQKKCQLQQPTSTLEKKVFKKEPVNRNSNKTPSNESILNQTIPDSLNPSTYDLVLTQIVNTKNDPPNRILKDLSFPVLFDKTFH